MHIAIGVALHTFSRFGHLHLDGSGQVDGDRFVVHAKDAVGLCFDEEVLRIFDDAVFEDQVFKRFRIHEMVTVGIDVAEFELGYICVQDLDGVSRANLGVGTRTGVQVEHCDLHKAGLAALCTVLHIEYEVRIALIVEDFAFADFGGRCHE